MISRHAAIAASLLALPSAIQAQSAIPQPVIEQCNTTASASEMPDCLKNGAVGFEMLELARSEEFYGATATPVIDSCAARNESFETTWLCFKRAAADASETGSLIGRDNIADSCVASISDPALNMRIGEIYEAKREKRFPDKMFFGGQMFYAFQGCPEPAAVEDASEAPLDTAPDETAVTGLGADACKALGEVEDLVAASSADELRAFGADLREMEAPSADQLASTFNFSNETAEYLAPGDEKHAMTVATTLGVFIDEHHPELLMELFQEHETPTSDMAGELSDEIARGILAMFIDTARERYQSSCKG